MKSICLYFQAHQPYRIRELSFFEMGGNPELFDHKLNKKILSKVSGNSYLPSFDLFQKLIKSTKGKFRFSLSLTGVLLEQLKDTQPEIVSRIGKLQSSGSVELLGETYYHSFASLYSLPEFEEQVNMHREILRTTFKAEPVTFRNTELAFRSDIVKSIEKLGFRSILIEGSDRTLKGKNPNYLYGASGSKNISILTRNQEFSALFTCRKGIRKKAKYPDPENIIEKLVKEEGNIINIWFDIECLGEHQKATSGIFDFFEKFVKAAIRSGKVRFILPSEVTGQLKPEGTIEIYSPVTWHEKSNDISAWNGNIMQIEAMKYIYGLEKKLTASRKKTIIESWRRLQSSDHLLYLDTMETEGRRPAQQFSPFKSPHDAYIYLMNALANLEIEAGNGN